MDHDIGPVTIRGERLSIPARIHVGGFDVDSPAPFAPNEDEALILACLLSRHTSGYVRQRFVPPLVRATRDWVPPFVIQLLAEYVREIAEAIEGMRSELAGDRFTAFARENPAFMTLTRQRIVSYWGLHYRNRFGCEAYPSYRVLRELGLWDGPEAKRWIGNN